VQYVAGLGHGPPCTCSCTPLSLGSDCTLVGIALAHHLSWVVVLFLPARVAAYDVLIGLKNDSSPARRARNTGRTPPSNAGLAAPGPRRKR
jgi:hypothetical protein